jgi:SSS family solute:Na+ symporter
MPGYIGLFALTFNLIVTALCTFIFDGVKMPRGLDATRPEDYLADSSDVSRTGVRKIIVT